MSRSVQTKRLQHVLENELTQHQRRAVVGYYLEQKTITQLAEEFFRAVTVNAGLTVHMSLLAGRNDHHRMEALFKAFGLALRDAVRLDANIQGVLSTKGTLD